MVYDLTYIQNVLAEGGPTPEEKITEKEPEIKKDEGVIQSNGQIIYKPKVRKDANLKAFKKSIRENRNNFILDPSSAQYSDIEDNFKTIHNSKEVKGSCTAGASVCSRDYLAPLVSSDIKSLRTVMANSDFNIKESDYSIKSRANGYLPNTPFEHTEGVDAWEYEDVVIGENLGRSIYKRQEGSTGAYYGKNNLPSDFDYSQVPVGALVHMGNSKGRYTEESNSSHMGVVVGFSEDGMPLLYDYGELKPLNKSLSSINSITVPNDYEDYTFNNINSVYSKEKINLGYDKPINRSDNTREYITTINKSMDTVAADVGTHYNINKDTLQKLQKRVIGIGAIESNFNELGEENTSLPRNLATNYGDSWLMNEMGKPGIKSVINLFAEDKPKQGELSDWELELKLRKQYPNMDMASDKWRDLYNTERDKVPSPNRRQALNSSYGPYKIKDMPKYAKDLGYSKEATYGFWTGSTEELSNSAPIALIHLAENYIKYKNKYPDLTDDQLIDLVTVSYKSGSKPQSQKFINNYIKNENNLGLTDGYLEAVKTMSNKYDVY